MAVEAGARIPEENPKDTSVGYGGMPDRDGHVTLDACIMDEKGGAGSVCFMEEIMHPISVARKVMENTPHVMLAGEGALQYALSEGFTRKDLLTTNAKQSFKKWREKSDYAPEINVERHDTIGMLALDLQHRMCGRLHHQRTCIQDARKGGGQPHHWSRIVCGWRGGCCRLYRTGRVGNEDPGLFCGG